MYVLRQCYNNEKTYNPANISTANISMAVFISGKFWSFECNISSFCVSHHCYFHCVLRYPPSQKIFWYFISILIVELLIYSKKCLLIYQNKNYSSICKSIITSSIGFNLVLTNLDARLKQRCINVLLTLSNVVWTLCNVSTVFQRRALTLHDCCECWKSDIGFCFICFIVLIHNVETMLIRRCNFGLDISLFNIYIYIYIYIIYIHIYIYYTYTIYYIYISYILYIYIYIYQIGQ